MIFGNGFGGEGEFGRDDIGDGFERDGLGDGVPGLVGEPFLEDESVAVGEETEIGGSEWAIGGLFDCRRKFLLTGRRRR